MRFQAPIFTYKNILDKAGIYLKVNPDKDQETQEDGILVDDIVLEDVQEAPEETYANKSLKELHKLLEKAVLGEDYELAAKIRDEISKR